jgi:hypothetical protein
MLMEISTYQAKYRRNPNEIYSSESEEEINVADIPPHLLAPPVE